LPDALAVINPKRHDCDYPEKMLAGVGVALKLVQALLQESGRGLDLLPHFIKVAAIGTLADVVPLLGENRVIARCGLDGLSIGPHGGRHRGLAVGERPARPRPRQLSRQLHARAAAQRRPAA
jgi:single-stranded-DNA-specific exonuclease